MDRSFHPVRFLLLAGILLSLFSCGESEDIENAPCRSFLTLQDTPPAYGAAGGSARLSFSTNASWRIEPELSEGDPRGWFSINPPAGDAGKEIEVTVRVDPNEGYTSRSVTLRLRTEPAGSEPVLEERIEITQAKKNVILLGDNRREIGSEQQTLSVEVQSNVDYSVTVKTGSEWIEALPESRAAPGLEEHAHRFAVSANPDAQERTGVIVFTDKDSELFDELTIVQAAWEDPDPERTALKGLYDAGSGGGWKRSDNWCSDKPLGEWYGVETDAEGRVTALRLQDNNLSGAVLKYVGALTSLKHLDLSRNKLEEDLDFFDEETLKWRSHLDDLLELETIDMSHNRLTGRPPGNWSRFEKVRYIDLSSNRLTGKPIPIQWEPLYRNGRYIDVILNDNYLGGSINDFVLEHPQWSRIALQFIRQKLMISGNDSSGGLTYEDVILPDFTYTDLRDGSQHSMRGLYTANKLTMLLQWNPLVEESNRFMETVVKRFHTLYAPQGFAVVAITPEGEAFKQAAERYLQTHEVAWPVVTEYADAAGKRVILPEEPYPSFFMVDQNGEVVEDMYTGKRISDPFWVSGNPPATADLADRPFEIIDKLNLRMNQTFGYSTYRSTDYSMDKQYETLQTSTREKGIDIVLIGEAFTDVDIETGFYREVMEFAMESFFSLEPLKSYREYFNVHMVYAVSRDSHIGYWRDDVETALGVIRENTREWCDISNAVYNILPQYYHLPVASNVLVPTVGVIINNISGGVTYMQSYGLGPCHAFSGYLYGDLGKTRGTYIHETAGHSFGLLGDEYDRFSFSPGDEIYLGQIPESDKRVLMEAQKKGWYLNLSLSNNPNQVSWSHLIGHPRFPYVGIFEGGHYYAKGVWRSEDQSVMRQSRTVQYFNAISREMIVKRIMELSGEAYTFEKFLAKDRDAGRPGKAAASIRKRTYIKNEIYHQPPILGE